MRLSAKKAAHHFSQRVLRCRKSGEAGFPVELCRATELHAAFREESRTSFLPASAALQEIRGSREPALSLPKGICGFTVEEQTPIVPRRIS
jgi:hypothetical protein